MFPTMAIHRRPLTTMRSQKNRRPGEHRLPPREEEFSEEDQARLEEGFERQSTKGFPSYYVEWQVSTCQW